MAAVAALALFPLFDQEAPGQISSSTTTTPPSTTQTTDSSTPSPTSSSSPGQVPPPPTSLPNTSTTKKTTPTTTTTTTSTASTPGTVQEQRVVELIPQDRYNWTDIEYWRQAQDSPGEVRMDDTGLQTALGAKLAVIEDAPAADRDRCSQVTAWRDRVEFSELHEGSQLCGRSRVGRYASLKVQTVPASQSSNGRFIFYGITWN
ncbi:hypothetical protein [Lentzea sp. NPDC059081]|uniref:hypothetical protein n=1 Tax=Lentzea sp. NPDC059081 TaxID=3346719 RepID=UPI003691C5D4